MKNAVTVLKMTVAMVLFHMWRSAVSAGRSGSRKPLGKRGNRGNMLTRRFAFVPPCGE